MKWVVPTVVAGFALVCSLVFLLAMQVQSSSLSRSGGYATPVTSASPYYGSGPEWDKLAAAEQKGKDGWKDVQALMLSSDDQVASQAARVLSQKSTDAQNLFFEQFPNVSPTVKSNIGSDHFNTGIFDQAVRAVKGPAGPRRDGAVLFLNTSYMRFNNSDVATRTLKGLAEAVPGADDKLRGELSYTLSLYALRDLGPMVTLLGHEEAGVRKAAVVALGKTGRADSLNLVRGLLDDPSAGVRKAAQQAEKSIDAAVKAAAVAAATPDPYDPSVRAAERQSGRKRLGMP